MTEAHQPYQVVPAHHLVRGVRRVESIPVHAAQHRSFQETAGPGLPAELCVHVAHRGGEIIETVHHIRKGFPQGAELPGQRGVAHREDVGQLLPEGTFRCGTDKEIVQRDTGLLRIRRRLRDHPQMRRREIAVPAVEAAFGQRRPLRHF